MEHDASVCPKCLQYRKDIHNTRIQAYTYLSISGIAGLYGLIFNDWTTFFFQDFEWSLFFTSISGLAMTIFLVLGCLASYITSKKLGTWWWY